MLSIFKKYDLIDELDERINKDENVFVECLPNKIPYILKIIRPYLTIEILIISIDFIYSILKPETIGVFLEGFEIFLIALNVFPIYFLLKSILEAIPKVNNTYYVITDSGIHMLNGGKSLEYIYYTYEDIKSISLNKYKFAKNKGDIIIKELAEKEMKKFLDKFFYVRNGLIAVDDAQKIYDILKQISSQDNENIFFEDEDMNENIDYYKDVKKYNRKIDNDKDDSLIQRRS